MDHRTLDHIGLAALLVLGAAAAEGAIDIDSGRQLFVDDYLVESTNGVVRHWNKPVKIESPILRPTKEDCTRIGGCTVATDGGLWWDPTIGKFRLWYEDNWAGNMLYAESKDGLKWEFPDLGKVKGTNRVFSDGEQKLNRDLDSWSVWPNYKAANPYADWKMFVSKPGAQTKDILYSSSDGRIFRELGLVGWSNDRSTMHFDSMLGKWVYSLRAGRNVGRARDLLAVDELSVGGALYWVDSPWIKDVKKPDGVVTPEHWTNLDGTGDHQLYNFDAVPYESLMLGVREVLHVDKSPDGKKRDNEYCCGMGLPKTTALQLCFSRDGRNYARAPGDSISPSGWGSGKWDTGYLSAIGGICVVKDERLWFYYTALRGDATKVAGRVPMYKQGMYYNGSIGAATLRRDGFCGIVADGMGELVTKPVVFTGSRLFVNAECFFGYVEAEILDAEGKPIPGYSKEDCAAFWYGDSTKRELVFRGRDLSALIGREVRFRFLLNCATLYSFWVSPTANGESRGYVAAGGPKYRGLRDMPPADVTKSRAFPKDYVKRADAKTHSPSSRASTLVSSLAVAPNGRLWATWYCGITPGEDQNNYVVLATSDDDGKTWREVFVADPDGTGMERPFDPEVWVAPDGSLRWIWADRICRDLCGRKDNAYPDIVMMATIPDANAVPENPPQPRGIAEGVMMCKPTVLRDGTWAFPVARWGGRPWSSCMYVSCDGGKTFSLRGGTKVPQEDSEFDEHMFVERKNGDIVCYSRAKSGIREAVSRDGGFTWGASVKSKLPHPSARCFVRRLKSGAWLLVKHGGLDEAKHRSHLTAYVSDDEGVTWKGGLLLEERWGCSYPDGQEASDGTIYITYDWDRYNDRTIYFCTFTEADVRAGKSVSGKTRLRQVISKGTGRPVVDPVYIGVPRRDHFWNLRKWIGKRVEVKTPGGRMWKAWCADGKRDFDSHDAYAVLSTSADGGRKWKEVLVVDPDDFWPRRPEQPKLAVEGGKLIWTWVDRVSWNKDGAGQTWRLVLDAEREPDPSAKFKAEFVRGGSGK